MPEHALLFVCTANQARSAMAAGVARALLGERGLGERVAVSSAGFFRDGSPALAEARRALRARGVDVFDHRSRRLDAEILVRTDLVLTMTRDHVREAAVLAPDLFPRMFTLREFVRRSADAGSRAVGEDLDAYLARIASGRVLRDLLGDVDEDDVADPVGRPAEAFEALRDELWLLVTAVLERTYPDGV